MKKLFAFFLLLGLAACQPEATDTPVTQDNVDLGQKAEELAQKFILTDTHIDLPYRLEENMEDIEKICSGNLLRVWSEVERVARELQSQ